MENSIDADFFDQFQDETIFRKYVIPGDQVPRTWGRQPGYLLSKILASKGALVRKINIDTDRFFASIYIMAYENGNLHRIHQIWIPPLRIPEDYQGPRFYGGGYRFTDLIIRFQEDENGELINPRWETAISDRYWADCTDHFILRL